MTDLRPKLLLVEDHPAFQDFASKLLEKYFEITVVGSIRAAKEQLALQSFDILLLDLGLPNGAGVAVIRETRPLSDCPLVVLSGHFDYPIQAEAMLAGADDFVEKTPENMKTLHQRIFNAIRRRQGQAVTAPPGARSTDYASLKRRREDTHERNMDRAGWLLVAAGVAVVVVVVTVAAIRDKAPEFSLALLTIVVMLIAGGAALFQRVKIDKVLPSFFRRSKDEPPPDAPHPPALS